MPGSGRLHTLERSSRLAAAVCAEQQKARQGQSKLGMPAFVGSSELDSERHPQALRNKQNFVLISGTGRDGDGLQLDGCMHGGDIYRIDADRSPTLDLFCFSNVHASQAISSVHGFHAWLHSKVEAIMVPLRFEILFETSYFSFQV